MSRLIKGILWAVAVAVLVFLTGIVVGASRPQWALNADRVAAYYNHFYTVVVSGSDGHRRTAAAILTQTLVSMESNALVDRVSQLEKRIAELEEDGDE